MSKLKTFLITTLIILSSCQPETSFQFSTYWWKNNTRTNKTQQEFLTHNEINKVYLKVFDLKWNEGNNTISVPKVYNSLVFDSVKIIPVIYIENGVLLNFEVDSIYNIILNHYGAAIENGIIKDYTELQIDCDWTLQSKKAYFKLLKLLSNDITHLSATIRLHQIKYAKTTGIPPVEKGVIMIYNLESPADTSTKNSIFSYDKALMYLDGYLKEYQLKVDIALPAFSWGVHYHHGKIKALISGFNPNKIDSLNMYQRENGYFKSKKAHFINTHRISNRDEIRYEYPRIKELEKMMRFLEKNINQDTTEVIFFSLNSEFLINNKSNYEKIISTYR